MQGKNSMERNYSVEKSCSNMGKAMSASTTHTRIMYFIDKTLNLKRYKNSNLLLQYTCDLVKYKIKLQAQGKLPNLALPKKALQNFKNSSPIPIRMAAM